MCVYWESAKDKYNSLFDESNPHNIKNRPILNVPLFLGLCAIICAFFAVLYLLTMGLGILFTLITMSNKYSINTGCKYNDTVHSNNNTDYLYYYCISGKTGEQYDKLTCSTDHQDSVWGMCFIIGIAVDVGIALIVLLVVQSIGLWETYKSNKSNNDDCSDKQSNDDIVVNLESETCKSNESNTMKNNNCPNMQIDAVLRNDDAVVTLESETVVQ